MKPLHYSIGHRRKHVFGRKAFTLLEVLVAMGVLSLLLGSIGVFFIEVMRSYYGAAAKTSYASDVRKLADQIGRDVISSYTTTVYRSTDEDDWDDPTSDQLGAGEAGRFLFLVQATVNYDSLPAYERIDSLIAYTVDTSTPVLDQDDNIIGYPLFRYELEIPDKDDPAETDTARKNIANEDWVLQVNLYANGTYDLNPGATINHPAEFEEYADYIEEILNPDSKYAPIYTREYMLTVSPSNGAFNPDRAFIKLPNDAVALALGVVASNTNISGPDENGAYHANGSSIVTANTLNLTFAPRGYE